ncbi:MAG: phosphatidylserine/phosphatidylglycerophosphate/cardiolipin synthase family protein [Patescibacteria group bacterium]
MKEFSGGQARLIVDGDSALSEILNAIKRAKKTIRMRVYMWRDDEVGRLVLAALQRKIKTSPTIKIFIEKDAFGSRVYNLQKIISWGRMKGDIFSSELGLNFLRQKRNVHFVSVGSRSLILFKILKENDHSKVFLFDDGTQDSLALVGGMNIANEHLTAQNHSDPDQGGWHDYMVLLRGELADRFALHFHKRKTKWLSKKIRKGFEILMDISSRRVIKREMIREISKARRSIIIQHGYLTDFAIIRKLRQASRRGVHVQVIIADRSDGVLHANMHSVYKLLKSPTFPRRKKPSVKVHLYRGMIHAKVIVIDKAVAIIGSANLTGCSFNLLSETNAIFRQKDGIVRELLAQVQKDLHHCVPVTLANIPPYRRWLAWWQKIFI